MKRSCKEDRKKWKKEILSYLDKNPEKEYTVMDLYTHFRSFNRTIETFRAYLTELVRDGLIQKNLLGYINLYSTKKETQTVEPPVENTHISPLVVSIYALKESLDHLIQVLEKKEPPQ